MEQTGFLESLRILFRSNRGYRLVTIANFGDGVAYFGFIALMTLFLERYVGFSLRNATIGVSLFTGAVTLFMALGGGTVSDRLGVRRALSLSFLLLFISRFMFVIAPTIAPVTTALAWTSLLVMAFGEGIIQPALYSGAKEYSDERTKTLAYAFIYSIMNLGIMAGGFLSPLIRELWAKKVEGLDIHVEGNQSAGTAGALWFFVGITLLFLLVNHLFFTRKVEREDRNLEGEVDADEADVPFVEKLRSLPILDARFLFFTFILLPVRTLFAHQWLTMPHYVERSFPAAVGARWEWLTNVLNPALIVVLVPLIAALTRSKQVVDMMIVGTAISALAALFLVADPSLPLLILFFLFFTIGESTWSSRFYEYVADIAPVNRVGIYMGVAFIPWFLAKATTGFYAGTMLEIFIPKSGAQSPGSLWLIYALFALISPLALLAARRWLISGVSARPRS